jgi:hypothetical protein
MKDKERNWLDIQNFFIGIFLREGYDRECSEVLGFYISQVLEDAAALLNAAEECKLKKEINYKELILLIHILFQKDDNLLKGHKILMDYECGDIWADITKKT